jgi:transcriptional regulator with XRE-family HTH domain
MVGRAHAGPRVEFSNRHCPALTGGAFLLAALARLRPITYQQVRKYECGVNRVSAGRLFEIARVLGVPVGYFYEGLADEGVRPETPRERMMLEVARNFAAITDERQQDAVSTLARVLAGTH